MHRIVELERRLARLEANRGASLRFGEVVSVSPDGFARVSLPDGDGMVSAPLRIVQRRTLKDKDQCFPDVGEQVACLFAGQGMEQGLILGAVYSTADPAAGQDAHMGYYQYEDGTVISYDRNAHKLVANVQGEVEVKATKTATVEAAEGITAKTPRQLVLEGGAGVVMRGPTLSFEGMAGGACEAAINANLKLNGNLTQQGNFSQQGSQSVSGSITAGGTITGNPVEGCNH